MGRFLDELDLRDTGRLEKGRPVFLVLHEFRYEYGSVESGGKVHVPAGFETDLASVPRLLWSIAPIWMGQKAAVVHDYLYVCHEETRALADGIFRNALGDAGVGPIRRWLMWVSVRLFGRIAWRT